MPTDTPKKLPSGACKNCWKAAESCICELASAQKTKLNILILQHPREATAPLGTARLASLCLPHATHRVGLSWPSLSAALRAPKGSVQSSEWGVLVVASRAKSKTMKGPYRLETPEGKGRSVQTLKGLIVLDGNWKQAKALWWRNPWLNRLSRLELNPKTPSAYGNLRREPRANCLSTIEAMGVALTAVGESPKVGAVLQERMEKFISSKRETKPQDSAPMSPPPSQPLEGQGLGA